MLAFCVTFNLNVIFRLSSLCHICSFSHTCINSVWLPTDTALLFCGVFLPTAFAGFPFHFRYFFLHSSSTSDSDFFTRHFNPLICLFYFTGDPEWDLAEQHVVEAALVGVDSVNAAGGLLPDQWGGPYLLEPVVRTVRVSDDPARIEEAGERSLPFLFCCLLCLLSLS